MLQYTREFIGDRVRYLCEKSSEVRSVTDHLWPQPGHGVRSGWNSQSLSFQRFPIHPLVREIGRRVVVHQGVLPMRPKRIEWWALSSKVRRDRAIGVSPDRYLCSSRSVCQQFATPGISDTNPETENTTVLKLCVASGREGSSSREEQEKLYAGCNRTSHDAPSSILESQ